MSALIEARTEESRPRTRTGSLVGGGDPRLTAGAAGAEVLVWVTA